MWLPWKRPHAQFSVIIPAYNAAATLGETLDSVLAQTYSDWEAIVVNDGSTDETGVVAARYAKQDRRIRVLRQPNRGMTAARNAAIRKARGGWLVFLDADDWFTPEALASFLSASDAAPDASIVCGGWVRVAPGGEALDDPFRLDGEDLFAVIARFCPFAVHSCAVQRRAVRALRGFDPRFRLCADWDLWQRAARTGIRFSTMDARVALYRMSPGSSVRNVEGILAEGLEIIKQGHGRDPRVKRPAPKHADGIPSAGLAMARLRFLCWQAGIMLGRGEDARPLLQALAPADRDPELEPFAVAHAIYQAALLPDALVPSQWSSLWGRISDQIEQFLTSLEERAAAPGLSRRAVTALERLIIAGDPARPLTVGRRQAVRVEVTEPIPDLPAPASVEYVDCSLTLEGGALGTLELPVCGPTIPAAVLADAIAAQHTWVILGRFFARHIYPELEREAVPDGVRIRRGTVVLGTVPGSAVGSSDPRFHDTVGWTVFLQELWGHPEWEKERFYAYGPEEAGPSTITLDSEKLSVQISEPIPNLWAKNPVVIEWLAGGSPVLLESVEPPDGFISSARLRAHVMQRAGFELARIIVREALIGTSLEDPMNLRERLRRAARAAEAKPDGRGLRRT